MYGLDRAGIFVEVETDIYLIKSKIESIFPNSISENTSRKTKTYNISQKNINTIKVEESYRGATLKKTVIRIDFSYPREKNQDNIFPVMTELGKKEIEANLLQIINRLTEEPIQLERLRYDFLEFCIQEKVGAFYKYHNIISFFYRALTRKYEDINKVQYYNFNTKEEKHYTTGFIFQPYAGWKLRLYSKGHEHNRNHETKVRGAILRLEHRLSKTVIKSLVNTIYIQEITIEKLKEKISEKISRQLYEIIVEEIYHSHNVLVKVLQNFKSRQLSGIIRDNQEWILDEKIVDDIISNTSLKSYPQIKRYRARVRAILLESQARASPKRDFFGNIERLENFLNNLLFIPCKVECNNQKHLTFFFTKKYHNYEPFLTIPK